jgi:O-antigen/teichoic acid export membrane protein
MKLPGAIGRLGKDSFLYGSGQMMNRAVQAAVLYLLTRVFPPAEFGVVDLVMTVSVLATLFIIFGMDSALARSFYDAPDSEARRTKAMTSALHRVIGGGLIGLVLVIWARPVSVLLLRSASYEKYVRLLGWGIPFSSFFAFCNEALRVTFQPKKFIGLNAFNAILLGGLTLWFVKFLRLSVAGVFWAKLFADASTALVGVVLVRHVLTRRGGSWADFRTMIAYGAPLVPMALIYYALTYADRQVLVRMSTMTDVGVYGLAARIATPVLMAIAAFQLAWGPSAFAAARQEGHGAIYSRVLNLYVAGGAAVALLTAFAAPLLVRIVPQSYEGAWKPGGLLALSAVANGAYYIVAVGVQLKRENGWLVLTTAVAAVVTIGLAILWVGRWGVTGVALATLVGFSVSSALLYSVSQSRNPFPYRGLACLAIFLVAVALSVASWWVGVSVPGFALRLFVWLAFAAVAWRFAMRGVEPGSAKKEAAA